MNNFIHWPKMWWRRKGFGVHSPFAFSLITRTIAERGEYYSYPELRQLSGNDFRLFSLLFRLICRFKPTTVNIFSTDSRIKAVTKLADSRIVFNNAVPDMLVIDNLSSKKELNEVFNTLSSLDNKDCYILIFNIDRGLNAKLLSMLNDENSRRGMTFSNGRTAILCRCFNLPQQSFMLLF